MTALTTEKLGRSVGAEVARRRLRPPAARRRRSPHACLEVLEENGALVFRDLHVDDETQVAFSRKLGKVEVSVGKGELPEIFRVTLDPAKNPAADYLRGHVRLAPRRLPPTTSRSWRRCSARTRSRRRAARPSSPARTRPTTTSPTTSRSGTWSSASCTPSRPRSGWSNPDPSTEGAGDVAEAAGEDAPAGLAAPVGAALAGARRDRPSHVEGMEPTRGARLLAELLARSTTPDRVYRHEWAVGDMVIWDNRGVLHRALPVRRVVGARHAPHDDRRRRADPMTERASPRIPPLPPDEWADDVHAGHRRAATGGRDAGAAALARAARRVSTCSAPSRSIPTLMHAYHSFNGHILYTITLSARQRELLDPARRRPARRRVRVGSSTCVIARDAGIDRRRDRAHRRGSDAPGWSTVRRRDAPCGRRAWSTTR